MSGFNSAKHAVADTVIQKHDFAQLPFGPHHAQVMQVVDFARTGELCCGKRLMQGFYFDYDIVRKMPNEGVDIDFGDLCKNGKPEDMDSLADEWTFRDIYGDHFDYGPILNTPAYAATPLKANLDALKFNDLLEGRLGSDPHGLRAWIAVFLSDAARHRAVFGIVDHFFEHVFQVLQSGGVPVAWADDRKHPQLLVFYPHYDKLG